MSTRHRVFDDRKLEAPVNMKYVKIGPGKYRFHYRIRRQWKVSGDRVTQQRIILPLRIEVKLSIFLRLIAGPRFFPALAIHQFIYNRGGRLNGSNQCLVNFGRFKSWANNAHHWERKEADDLLRIMIKINGMGLFIRNIVYYGIRLFGWRKWVK